MGGGVDHLGVVARAVEAPVVSPRVDQTEDPFIGREVGPRHPQAEAIAAIFFASLPVLEGGGGPEQPPEVRCLFGAPWPHWVVPVAGILVVEEAVQHAVGLETLSQKLAVGENDAAARLDQGVQVGQHSLGGRSSAGQVGPDMDVEDPGGRHARFLGRDHVRSPQVHLGSMLSLPAI